MFSSHIIIVCEYFLTLDRLLKLSTHKVIVFRERIKGMRQELDKIKSIFRFDENLPLEVRLYFSSLLLGFVLCLLGSVVAIIYVPSVLIISLCYILAAILFLAYWLGQKKGIIRPLIVPVVLISYVAIFIIWIKGGGINGPNLFPNFVVLVLAIIIVPDNFKKYLLLLFVVLLFAEYFIELYFPHWITQYPSEFSRLADTLFTSVFSAVFVYFIIINLYRNHQVERKRAEENEAKFKILYDRAPDLYYSISTQGIIINCNETFLRTLGYARKEVIGRAVFDLIDASVIDYAKGTFEQFLQTGVAKNRELLVVKKDGTKIVVSLNAEAVRDEDGKILYSVSCWRDITDQKIAEKELRNSNELLSLFIKQSPIYAFIKKVTSVESRIVYVSDNYHNMVGVKASEMIGKTVAELFDPYFAKQIMEEDWCVVQSGKITRVEQKYNNRIYDTIKFPITLDDKNLLAGYSIDITDHVNSSFTIQEQNRELQKMNNDKDVFISILAHDLKNPFNALLGFSSLLVENIRRYDIDKIEKHLKLININSHKAYNLLEDILLWTRTQSGKISYEPQSIDLNEISTEVVENINLSAINKSIRIEWLNQKEISLFADKNMLTTILRNLLSNAVKFTNWGGLITVIAETSGNWATITVKDNGIGMDENKRSQLFDFTQKSSTSGTGGEPGTGFGLLLCKDFVEKHGGTIWVESEYGKGSSFMFTIPLNIM